MSVDHYENFPVASWLCPAPLRPPIRAIYWFARTADDIADEGSASASARQDLLKAYRQQLERALEGLPIADSPWRTVFEDLQVQHSQFEFPQALLHDLLTAFERDLEPRQYASHDDLLDYCRYSAQPIGRLLLHLYGVTEQRWIEASDKVCSALQLINFWQDLSVDLPRGRCYLPKDVLDLHGLEVESFLDGQTGPDLAPRRLDVVRDLTKRAVTLMNQGAPLARALPGRAGWELRLVIQGGLQIGQKIASQGYDTLNQRPRLRWTDMPPLVWRACTMFPPAILESKKA